ncbi:MAG: Copper binding protein plastocyanin/azurin family [Bacteroidetes bacterium]|nr:Copper binding protein plastocyanin/azurin family [Bacteroidota bacterium]
MKTLLLFFLFSLLIVFACKKKDNTPQGENEVWLLYKRFNPTVLNIKRGTTLTFINKDNANHTVTESNKKFSSGKIQSGNKYEFTFNDSTSYSIYCSYHPDNLQEQLYITVK